jgi:hypothetical protein
MRGMKISVDLNTDTADIGAARVKLRPAQAEFLFALIAAPARHKTFAALADAIWGKELGPSSWLQVVNVYASTLRRRLKPYGFTLATEDGGYRLVSTDRLPPRATPLREKIRRAPKGNRKCRKCVQVKDAEHYSKEVVRRGWPLIGSALCDDCNDARAAVKAARVPRPSRPRWSDAEKAKLAEAISAKMTLEQTAQFCGRSVDAVTFMRWKLKRGAALHRGMVGHAGADTCSGQLRDAG